MELWHARVWKFLRFCYNLPKCPWEMPLPVYTPTSSISRPALHPWQQGEIIFLNLYQWDTGGIRERGMPPDCCFHLHLLITGKEKFNIFYRFVLAIYFVLFWWIAHFMLLAYFPSLGCSCFPYSFVKTYNIVLNSISTFQLYVMLQ